MKLYIILQSLGQLASWKNFYSYNLYTLKGETTKTLLKLQGPTV